MSSVNNTRVGNYCNYVKTESQFNFVVKWSLKCIVGGLTEFFKLTMQGKYQILLLILILNVCPFDYTAVAGSVKVWPVNQVNHTSWLAVVTPTDRPKSVRNRCVIELFVALFVFSLCPFDISVGLGAFVIGLSQISSFFSSF